MGKETRYPAETQTPELGQEPMAHDSATVAFDRASVRRVDPDGHLHIERTPISKANICPYYGREIPGASELGLEPERIYRLLRDPEELEKAASTFAGKPLLLDHEPVSAEKLPKQRVVGAVGDDVQWSPPYLTAPLTVWDAAAIKGIEDGTQREISSAYRYRADMTPGTYLGEHYDGVMREINGNHVALVREGRAGPDVVVADAAIAPRPLAKIFRLNAIAGHFRPIRRAAALGHFITQEGLMPSKKAAMLRGAIMGALTPKLAMDAEIDLDPVVDGVTDKNFDPKAIAAKLAEAAEGKLAEGQDLKEVASVIEGIKDIHVDDDPADQPKPEPKPEAEDDDPEDDGVEAKIRAILGPDATPEKIAALAKLIAPVTEDEDKPEMPKNTVDKPAMDRAIEAALTADRKRSREATEAREAVRPYVGKVDLALDSADAIYGEALKMIGVDIAGVHPSAFRTILKCQPKPAAPGMRPTVVKMASDSKQADDDFATRFPDAAAVRHV